MDLIVIDVRIKFTLGWLIKTWKPKITGSIRKRREIFVSLLKNKIWDWHRGFIQQRIQFLPTCFTANLQWHFHLLYRKGALAYTPILHSRRKRRRTKFSSLNKSEKFTLFLLVFFFPEIKWLAITGFKRVWEMWFDLDGHMPNYNEESL